MSVRRVRRALLLAAAILVFLVLAGATYQGVATALERRQFPYPGRLVDVGGHQLHLYCTGEGSPTVVLEAPAAGMSAAWAWIQPAIARTTRVCSYDRAGLGWSEAGEGGFIPSVVAGQLQTLLVRAGERPPYVLVGHGFGAALARLEAGHFGEQAAGLVLIDPPAELARPASRDGMTRLVVLSPWLARTGVLRATRMLSRTASGLPEPAAGAFTAFLNRPDHLTRAAREMARWNEVMTESSAVALPPSLPFFEIKGTGDQTVAFLTGPDSASHVTEALRRAIDAVRSDR